MFDFSSFLSRVACVTQYGEMYRYEDLSMLSNELSKYLQPHSLIFILCSNTVGSLIGYLSSFKANSASLLLNREIDRSLLTNLIDMYLPTYLWVPDEMVSECFEWKYCCSSHGYSLLKLERKGVILPEHLALLLTTSGSTGSPKLVRLSKENLIDNAKSIVRYLSINKEDRAITSLPMYYSYGLSVVNSHLISGATLLLTDRSYVQRDFWDFAVNHGATSFSGVPYTYEILKKMKFWNRDLPTLKTLTQAGGKLNNEVVEYFVQNARQRDINFYVMYGQTEATARMSYLPCKYAIEKLGSIGWAIPGGKFELRNESEVIDESEMVGELVYRGKNVCLGYAECVEDLLCGDDNRGILYTGDLAYRDKDGFYYIAGRKKRFLKLFGNRISLDYTECLLKREFDCDCACVGTDDKMIIYVTSVDEDEKFVIFLVNTIKLNKVAFEVRYIESIPRSETGKVLYAELPVT